MWGEGESERKVLQAEERRQWRKQSLKGNGKRSGERSAQESWTAEVTLARMDWGCWREMAEMGGSGLGLPHMKSILCA